MGKGSDVEQSRYRWVIVAAGGLICCVAAGSLFSLPIFLQTIARDTGWSVAGISGAMTIAFLAMAVGSIVWGNLSDRFGPRVVVLTGSAMLTLGLALASQVQSLLLFQILFGIVVGAGTAATFAPLMACVTGWFDTHRSLAVSLVSAGMGMAPMTMSPLAAWLVSMYDWRSAMLMIAGLAALLMLPVALLVRRPPALEAAPALQAAADAPAAGEGMSLRQVLRSPALIVLLLTNFFCCATHAGPIFHTVSYALSCGIPLLSAVTIYSVEGLAGLGGRIAFGLMGDRFGARRVLAAGLLVQAFGAAAFIFARELGSFYAMAALFGFVYAGVMPLYAVIARENFPLRLMGTVIGGIAMTGSLGMATGPLIGGLIFDQLQSYTWLYAGAWLLGIGAFLIAMTFKPVRPQLQPAPA
ncbi:MFS transporter [Ferrovibrio sp.]|uniref:MFS transporter n=1 Tax=Ferrovibrio sp. TaxID=1917215 RepID=UPI003D12B340